MVVSQCGNIAPHEPHEWVGGVSLTDHVTPVIYGCEGVVPPRTGSDALMNLTGEVVSLVASDWVGPLAGKQQSFERVTIRFASGRFLTFKVGLDHEKEYALDVSDARF